LSRTVEGGCKEYPREQGTIRKERIRDPLTGETGEKGEDQGEGYHQGKRLKNRPCNPYQCLFISDLDLP